MLFGWSEKHHQEEVVPEPKPERPSRYGKFILICYDNNRVVTKNYMGGGSYNSKGKTEDTVQWADIAWWNDEDMEWETRAGYRIKRLNPEKYSWLDIPHNEEYCTI